MKKNKGFTLIEILAVIVVLGLIGLIIIPKVTESIKNAKEKKFIVSANNLISIFNSIAIDKKANLEAFSGCSYNFETSVTDCPEFSYSGVLPDSGTISVDGDGNVTCSLNYNGIVYSCVDNVVIEDGTVESEYLFDYVVDSNKEQSLVVPKSGYYKLEVWGAQGGDTNGNTGGYGGYSTGFVWFDKGEKIYINVGGEGGTQSSYSDLAAGGYNGGGQGGKGTASNYNNVYSGAGGGGATHIALKTGILSFLSSDQEKVLIVAGGGGGAGSISGVNGGSGGGFIGVRGSSDTTHTQYYSTGGSQETGGLDQSGESSVVAGSFGLGSNFNGIYGGTGGGGGYYGGGGTNRNHSGAGGGSGYIGNSKVSNGVMYCYGCDENSNLATRTISTTGSNKDSVNCPNGYSDSAISKCAKTGNGYARITYIGRQNSSESLVEGTKFAFPYINQSNDKEQVMKINKTGYYKLEVWGAQGGSSGNYYVGGYGGYSSGIMKLDKGTKLYINVGGAGNKIEGTDISATGGYNGGGNAFTEHSNNYRYSSTGGGATHIALVSGVLANLESYKGEYDENAGTYRSNNILIVAGGGGGTWNIGSSSGWETRVSGQGGGASGKTSTGIYSGSFIYNNGGSQSDGFAFGQGQSDGPNGAGGGFYGGLTGGYAASGGSGYIGNPKLLNGVMYCYDCDENSGSATRTISTIGSNKDIVNCPNGYSDSALSNCAKAKDGYAVITYIGDRPN